MKRFSRDLHATRNLRYYTIFNNREKAAEADCFALQTRCAIAHEAQYTSKDAYRDSIGRAHAAQIAPTRHKIQCGLLCIYTRRLDIESAETESAFGLENPKPERTTNKVSIGWNEQSYSCYTKAATVPEDIGL